MNKLDEYFCEQSVPLWTIVDNRLERVMATNQELVLGRALCHYLRRCIVKFSKSGSPVTEKTKLLGNMRYSERTTGRGKGRATEHTVSFINEDYAFYYEELRHALQIAIYMLSGESVSLCIDLEQKSAWWRFMAGSSLSDVVR